MSDEIGASHMPSVPSALGPDSGQRIEISFITGTLMALQEVKRTRVDPVPFDGIVLTARGYVVADWVYAFLETDVPRLIKSIENPVGRSALESDLGHIQELAARIRAVDTWLAGVKLAGAVDVGSVRMPLPIMKVVQRIPRLVEAARLKLPIHHDTATAVVNINPDNAAAVVQEVAAQTAEKLPGIGRVVANALRPAKKGPPKMR